jgi:hypothetical protein
MFLKINHILCDKVHNSSTNIAWIIPHELRYFRYLLQTSNSYSLSSTTSYATMFITFEAIFSVYLLLNLKFSWGNIKTSLLFEVSTSNFKYIFIIITHMSFDKVDNSSVTISSLIPPELGIYVKKKCYCFITTSCHVNKSHKTQAPVFSQNYVRFVFQLRSHL